MSSKAGDRVGAILSAKDGKVNFLGFGIYMGYKPCPFLDFHENPMINLDNGKIVWGMQCWWGSEESIKKQLAGQEIINVEIDEEE